MLGKKIKISTWAVKCHLYLYAERFGMSQSMGFQKLKNLVNSDVLRSLLLSAQVRKQIAEHGCFPNLLTEKRQFKGEKMTLIFCLWELSYFGGRLNYSRNKIGYSLLPVSSAFSSQLQGVNSFCMFGVVTSLAIAMKNQKILKCPSRVLWYLGSRGR